jgi:hypothetical protein
MIKRKFFIHCYIANDWRRIYDQILSIIPREDSQIISVVSGKQIPDAMINPVLLTPEQGSQFEYPTLELLRTDCLIEGNEDIDYYYLHLKGLTRSSQSTEDWRSMMLYFLLRDVAGNSTLLDKYDAIGCNFCSGVPKENIGIHYSGNFWATRSKHIKKLAPLEEMKNRYGRLGAEFWIGSSAASASYYEFHSSKINHYSSLYPPSEYIGSTATAAYTI